MSNLKVGDRVQIVEKSSVNVGACGQVCHEHQEDGLIWVSWDNPIKKQSGEISEISTVHIDWLSKTNVIHMATWCRNNKPKQRGKAK